MFRLRFCVSGEWIDKCLRAGAKGGFRRNIAAWRLNWFRKNSVRLYSAQSQEDAERLLAGGEPWPTGLRRANIGQGLYVWESYAQVTSYLRQLDPSGRLGLRVMIHRVLKSHLRRFRTLDLRNWSDEAVDGWMNLYSHYGQALPHNYQHVIRVTGNFGVEHLFTPEAFQYFVNRLR
ncbi:hypothetical protein HYR99_14425 [Candidatus Poribacteria bacterium]|nr:hypothetical protein [Candidatus Poribacteria bacterium]